MVTVPFTPFEPDKTRYNVGAIPTAINVVPKADGGYGPLPGTVNTTALTEYLGNFNSTTDILGNFGSTTDQLVTGPGGALIFGSIQLPATCTGMAAARRADGTEALFAGTATALYLFDRTTFVFVDISGLSAPYVGTARWSTTQFGSYEIAQNGADPEQIYNIETDSVFSDNTTAPIAKYVATVGNFVFRGNIVSWASQSIIDAPAMIQCSALEDPTDNTPQNFNFSDYQSIPVGDEVMGIIPLTGGAHVPMRNAIQAMSVSTSGDYTFSLTPIDTMRGTSAPYSIGIIGQDDYIIYCDDGFYRYAGGSFQPIGNGRVNKWFLTECNQDDRENIIAMPDPEHNIVWIAYTASDTTRKMLGYHYIQDQWVQSDLAISASCQSRTFAYSGSGGTIVDGDLKRFAVIDTSDTLGYLVGSNRAATLLTNELQPGVRLSFANGAYLNGDPPTFTITPMTRDTPSGTQTVYSAASPAGRGTFVPFMVEGLKHQLQTDIPEGTDWTNVTGLEVPFQDTGEAA